MPVLPLTPFFNLDTHVACYLYPLWKTTIASVYHSVCFHLLKIRIQIHLNQKNKTSEDWTTRRDIFMCLTAAVPGQSNVLDYWRPTFWKLKIRMLWELCLQLLFSIQNQAKEMRNQISINSVLSYSINNNLTPNQSNCLWQTYVPRSNKKLKLIPKFHPKIVLKSLSGSITSISHLVSCYKLSTKRFPLPLASAGTTF